MERRKCARDEDDKGAQVQQRGAADDDPPEFVSRAMVERRRREAELTGLTWPTRLTIILVGTSILFSLFFGLEFLITKLATNYLASAGSGRPAPIDGGDGRQWASGELLGNQRSSLGGNLVCSRVDWLHLAGTARARSNAPPRANQSEPRRRRAEDDDDQSEPIKTGLFGRPASKLKVDFELIYEHDQLVARDGQHARLEGSDARGAHLRLQPELRLHQLLAAYHAAMPSNPDIWLHSEPLKQRHLLSGEARACRRQLAQLVDALAQATNATSNGQQEQPPAPLQRAGFAHSQLMRLLDSLGRPEAATLLGHPFWLGSYLECERLNELARRETRDGGALELTNGLGMGTRYCVGKLALKSWLAARHELGPDSSPGGLIKLGLCLPRACDSLALFQVDGRSNGSLNAPIQRLVKRLLAIQGEQRLFPHNQLELVDIFCLPLDERRRLSSGARLLLGAAACWLALLLACTFGRRVRGARLLGVKVNQKLLNILAIDVNLELFFQAKRANSSADHQQQQVDEAAAAINLNVLDSVRHLGCAGVIMAHVLLAYLTLGTSFAHTVDVLGRDQRTMLLLSLNNMVDTFFVISGLLATYLTLKKLRGGVDKARSKGEQRAQTRGWRKAALEYGKIVLRRYLRMAPLYFLVFAFAKLLAPHLGAGPLWDYATNGEALRGQCQRESWWWLVSFASDFKPIPSHCVPPAWSIAVDLQLFLLLPPLVFGMAARRPLARRLTYALIAALICLSTTLALFEFQAILQFVSLRDFAKLRLHVFTILVRYVHGAYGQPQNRMGPMLIGLLGGRLLFKCEEAAALSDARRDETGQPKEEAARNKPLAWLRSGACLKLALAVCCLSILAPCYVQLRERERARLTLEPGDLSWLARAINKLLLAPQSSSAAFDCYLALGGFVLIKPLWALANCLVLVRLATDLRNTLAARLLAGPFWQTISKLNYALLLIHCELVFYEAMSRLRHEGSITWSCLLSKFAFAYLFSLLLALPLRVLFEQPVARLLDLWLWSNGGGLRQQLRDMQASGGGRKLDELKANNN